MALDAVEGVGTVVEIAHKHDVHPDQVTEWRRQLLERAADVFAGEAASAEVSPDLRVSPPQTIALHSESKRSLGILD